MLKRSVICTTVRGKNGRTVTYDRPAATCSAEDQDLGDLMRAAGVIEGARTMKRILSVALAVLSLAGCNAKSPKSVADGSPAAVPLPAVDESVWRDVEAGKLTASLTMMCAGGLEDLERADPTLKNNVALQVPWSVQVTRAGKVQGQCVWTGPNGRTGRMVVDVLCKDDEDDKCSRFAYALEGDRKIAAVAHVEGPPPPIATTYPPGRDAIERQRSEAILRWARDQAPDEIGALRAEFQGVRVAINADFKRPVVCGQVRESGTAWRRFAIYPLGTPDAPTYHWLREPKDKAVADFCDAKDEGIQWYAVGDDKMGG